MQQPAWRTTDIYDAVKFSREVCHNGRHFALSGDTNGAVIPAPQAAPIFGWMLEIHCRSALAREWGLSMAYESPDTPRFAGKRAPTIDPDQDKDLR